MAKNETWKRKRFSGLLTRKQATLLGLIAVPPAMNMTLQAQRRQGQQTCMVYELIEDDVERSAKDAIGEMLRARFGEARVEDFLVELDENMKRMTKYLFRKE